MKGVREDWTALLAGRRRLDLGDGRSLRLLSALEALEAGREAEGLVRGDRERALCSNACLLARALERGGRPVYPGGAAVLSALTGGEIADLAGRWSAFQREEDPSPEDGEERLEGLKKVWSTRLGRAFAGACYAISGRCPRRRGPGR